MNLAVSKALEIYEAKVISNRNIQYFLSLPLDAPNFWQAFETAKSSSERVERLKKLGVDNNPYSLVDKNK